MRLPDVQKFDLELIKAVNATPWSIHSTAGVEGVFAKKDVAETEVRDSIVKVRKLYILPKDLELYGYTPGCKKCQSYLGGGKVNFTGSHSDACRTRLMNELAKSPEGAARIARIVDKADHYLADRLAEGDQRVAQGGLTVMHHPLIPLQKLLFRSMYPKSLLVRL